ncbi:hypothetical protein GCM10027445_06120 [Amycolatopsis endophytica]|uniref:ABC-type transport system involved in multi-copper enzyme maturation permease subunit n=1 Tax=Amycolatopsis endophytica TaxID=860233 RepID=A0A853AW11_9PSEU|nr:ABC transporter permease [Amycolatopsis endophytica]NYI86852.1 ABC-type transport system involved in multi-copper enzyme maturation permease subunit [Amycolatopsis endophytica]
MTGYLNAEFRKVLSLRAAQVAAGLCLIVTPAITALNAHAIRSRLAEGGALGNRDLTELGFETSALGAAAGVLLGVVAVSSEYTAAAVDAGGGRQILVTLTSAPRRGRLFVAKAVVVALVTAVLTAVAVVVGTVVGQQLLGPYGVTAAQALDGIGWRLGGVVVYCACVSVIALAIATFTRGGVVPLVVLLVNTTAVSVSFLLARVFPPAKFLPDAAGTQLFARNTTLPEPLSPGAGGLVLAVWTVLALVAGAVVFTRRDA